MDLSEIVPNDGDVYALSSGENYTRAEFVETPGKDGAEYRIGWRLYDRHGRGILLTEEEIVILSKLTSNYLEARDD